MLLHTHPDEFRELITVVAADKHIPESAVEQDYYIVMMLKALADSSYESLHESLLYTDEKQNFDEAIRTFDAINKILSESGE